MRSYDLAPRPPLSSLGKYGRRHLKRLRKQKNLRREERRGLGEEPQESLVLYKLLYIFCPTSSSVRQLMHTATY
jgi:hypothetical protein